MRGRDAEPLAIELPGSATGPKQRGAVLTATRVREIRAEVGVGSDVPVIELHVTRGATLKARILAHVITIVASLAEGLGNQGSVHRAQGR